MDQIVAVIPVRMASSRFPGKPFAPLHGLPMVEHVFRRAKLCSEISEVYVVTCDQEIRDVAESFGAKVIMTSAAHERATDRVAEAAEHLPAEIIVMIQGDEPMITPQMIQSALDPFRCDSTISCVNLAHRITSQAEFIDPNTIKVVADVSGNALYFSRSPIPHVNLEQATLKIFKQVCVIPFTRECLKEFAKLPATQLERAESIDMLRLLEHGRSIRIVETDVVTHSVDTPADLELVATMMTGDQLMQQYLS
jgi:3-deoxy-manno-octulosonate cytidylyltransferase (CMP-KDO synthetase)